MRHFSHSVGHLHYRSQRQQQDVELESRMMVDLDADSVLDDNTGCEQEDDVEVDIEEEGELEGELQSDVDCDSAWASAIASNNETEVSNDSSNDSDGYASF